MNSQEIVSTHDLPKGNIISTLQVHHVTFYVIESTDVSDWYSIYTHTKKDGTHPIEEFLTHEQALSIVEAEKRKLEAFVERKRKDIPTPRQLSFLFREKIPIPLTLTWGEASDLIDERLAEIAVKKRARLEAKQVKLTQLKENFHSFVTLNSPYHQGDKVLHSKFGLGTVLHAGKTKAGVRFQDGEKCVDLAEITSEKGDL